MQIISIKEVTDQELEAQYIEYVKNHRNANYCHDIAWKKIVEKVYGHKVNCFLAIKNNRSVGAFALTEFRSLFGGKLGVSSPFVDMGGPLADEPEIGLELINSIIKRYSDQRMDLEIRSQHPLKSLETSGNIGKVLPLLELSQEPDAKDQYWKSLKAKVRNQVRKADKSKVSLKVGKTELLYEFYKVFAQNMRDLGSPVHHKNLFAQVLIEFENSFLINAYRNNRCIGGLVAIPWKKSLVIPWASTLREERIHCPNNAIYWKAIEYAFDNHLAYIDFGRSTSGEGTHRFKKQWLAKDTPLYWYQINKEGQAVEVSHVAQGKLASLTKIWAKLPLPLANFFGPYIRGRISA